MVCYVEIPNICPQSKRPVHACEGEVELVRARSSWTAFTFIRAIAYMNLDTSTYNYMYSR
jgi:hypothetical protein